MAIIQCLTTSFLEDLFQGTMNFAADTFNIALYTSSATLDASTTAYTATGEASGVNYVAGGIALTGGTITASGNAAWIDFNDATFTNVTITFRGAMIYDTTTANASVCIIDGGIDRTATAQNVNVAFPAPGATTALITIGSV